MKLVIEQDDLDLKLKFKVFIVIKMDLMKDFFLRSRYIMRTPIHMTTIPIIHQIIIIIHQIQITTATHQIIITPNLITI